MHAFYDKFTDRARKSLELANQLAKVKKHPLVTNLHIFWGILEEHQNIANKILSDLGLDNGKSKREIEELLGYGTYSTHDVAVCYDRDACECICRAISIGMNKHKVVSCDDILLSLLSSEGAITNILTNKNITKELVEACLGAVVKQVACT